jgi:hypothetical protein
MNREEVAPHRQESDKHFLCSTQHQKHKAYILKVLHERGISNEGAEALYKLMAGTLLALAAQKGGRIKKWWRRECWLELGRRKLPCYSC